MHKRHIKHPLWYIWLFLFMFSSHLFAPFITYGQGVINFVPFEDDFESYVADTKLVNGLNGWTASDTNCFVVDTKNSPFEAGTKSAYIGDDVSLANAFDGESFSEIWMQMDVLPTLYDGSDYPEIDLNAASSFYINSNGFFVVRDGETWREMDITDAGQESEVFSESNWVRIHWRQDYATKKWDLFANYKQIAYQADFVNPDLESFSGFDMYNGSVNVAYLDSVVVSAEKPENLGLDGGDWLSELWVSRTVMSFDLTASIYQTNTFTVKRSSGFFELLFNIATDVDWLTVSETEGSSSGETVTIEVVCDATGVQPSEVPYTAQIIIEGAEANYGYPAKNTPKTIDVTETIGLSAPKNLNASDGTFADRVLLTWNDIPGSEFVVLRSETNDPDTADQIGVVTVSFFNDTTVTAGAPHYYWVRCQLQGIVGNVSNVAEGSLGVQPPAGLTATAGEFFGKVVLSWEAVGDADSYSVYRHLIDDNLNATVIAEGVTDTGMEDNNVLEGALYFYWIKSVAGNSVSHFSQSASGYASLNAPESLVATRGDYEDKIIVSWALPQSQQYGGVSSYRLLRSTDENRANAQLIKEFYGSKYEDIAVTPDVTYYYWLQAANRDCASEFAGPVGGWAATVIDYSYVYDGLDSDIYMTTSTVYSCNWGGFYHSQLDHYELAIGSSRGATDVKSWGAVGGSPYTWNGTMVPGRSYYASVRGVDKFGNIVVSALSSDGLMCVASSGSAESLIPVHRLYSYGDPKSTYEHLFTTNVTEVLFLSGLPSWQYEGIAWYGFGVETGDARPVYRLYCQLLQTHLYTIDPVEYEVLDKHNDFWQGEGPQFYAHATQGPGSSPVYRFYNPVVLRHFYTIHEYEKNEVIANTSWGWQYEGIAFYTFAKDFNREAVASENAMFRAVEAARATSVSVAGIQAPVEFDFSELDDANVEYVPGDYDGDGIEDNAWYNLETGKWYIWSDLNGVVLWGELWGGADMKPVAIDFNGDGVSDLAVYKEVSDTWFIRTVAGDVLVWDEAWTD
ncbi:MAG: hypothetical protein GX811_03490 [Lentisphaerae bacterium]|nr:hypothetical protein [Lentisphaerota bacterium]